MTNNTEDEFGVGDLACGDVQGGGVDVTILGRVVGCDCCLSHILRSEPVSYFGAIVRVYFLGINPFDLDGRKQLWTKVIVVDTPLIIPG